MTLIAIFWAVLLDWLIGDPYSWPHPVKWIGSYIYLCMHLQEKRQFSPYLFGFFLWCQLRSFTADNHANLLSSFFQSAKLEPMVNLLGLKS